MWQRGSKMSAYSQALQFPGIMESRGEQMWDISCGQIIDYKERSMATKHLKSGEHKKHAEQMKKDVTCPRHSAEVLSPQPVESRSATSSTLASSSVCTPEPAVKQIYLKSMLDGISEQSFSLAAPIDVQNWQKMGREMFEGSVTMFFCKRDLEEQFVMWQ